ncbi:hypothetical protein PEPCOX59622_00950 [Aedoeadaptatus coxii]|uniref:S-layer homology domain-containing protein n=1 Tax=Aedoeadaptatus coxii TaxID=755172 RepID=UPI00176BFBE6|nr:S-layer homology domain-containing protein [Peptoniphilus coxii]CAC9931664.1 hypothetical protein PEPCOX59622_00950 [Peptoniphilus coxii]
MRKRILSLVLSLAMLLSFMPNFAFAQQAQDQGKQLKKDIIMGDDGRAYTVFHLDGATAADILGYGPRQRAAGEEIPGFTLQLHWVGRTLKEFPFPEGGIELRLTPKSDAKKVIATITYTKDDIYSEIVKDPDGTEHYVGRAKGLKPFKKTEAFTQALLDEGVDMQIPYGISFHPELFATTFGTQTFILSLEQKCNPLWTTEWNVSDKYSEEAKKPDIPAFYKDNGAPVSSEFYLPKKGNVYSMQSNAPQGMYWDGKGTINIWDKSNPNLHPVVVGKAAQEKKFVGDYSGKLSDDALLLVSDAANPRPFIGFGDADNVNTTGFYQKDANSPKFLLNTYPTPDQINNPDVFVTNKVTGKSEPAYRQIKRYAVYEALNVKFNTGEGKLAADGKKGVDIGEPQEIGYSEKIAGNESGRKITLPDDSKLIPPEKPASQKTDNKFIGWALSKDATTPLFKTQEEANKYAEAFTKDTTFYAIYAAETEGKVAIQYVDQDGRAIDDKYKIKDEDYPKYAEGNKGEALEASNVPEPKFIGYKRVEGESGKIDVTGKTYNTEKIQTVEVKYEKLPDIIPEKKNGQDNPDVTPDVKEHYAKVTYQVAAADAEKAKLQLDNADATSPLVYYVNPLEGKKIKDVADVKALSKDKNLYKVDANDMWTFKPDSISSTDQEIMQARDTQDNVVKTEITLTAKVAGTDAKKYGDQLKAQDIVKWVGDQVDWKDGVQKIDGVTFKNVEDLGNRNTTNAGVFSGKLKVTFNDDSTKEVDNQKLIVRAKKGDKVTPGNDDPGTYPKDALEVKFAMGTGIEKLDPANKVMVLQKDEALEANDYPTVTVKANHETKANNVDYYDVQPGKLTEKETTITASTTEKGKKDVTFELKFYIKKDSGNKEQPSNALGDFKPTTPEKQTGKYVGSDITLPTFEDVKVTTGDLQGTWKFDGWYRNGNKLTAADAKVSANDAENNLVGKWILTETETAKVTREFAIDPAIVGAGKDVPASHALPKDVKDQKPNDTTNYIGSEQTPGKDKFNSVPEKIGDKEGAWTFKAWDKTKLTVDANEAMNKFTGTWTWTEKGKINIKYVFKAVGTDRALPQAILDQKPTDTSGYQAPADPTLPAVASHDVIVNGDKVGTWTRGDKWKKDTDTDGNITYTLIWTFKEIKSDEPVINPVKPGDKKIEGKGKPGSKVKVTIPGVEKPIEVDVNEKGDWTVEVPKDKKLKDGDVIKAKQKTPGLPESNEVTRKVEGDTPSEPKNYDGYINLEPVGEQEAKRATDIHVIYLYGYQDKTVHPQGDMTRAEAAAMVARLKNLDMSDTSKPDFKDCESRWYNSAINAVVKAGLMKGYPDGTFAPNGKITRAEFAQLIKGIDNPNMAELPFTDVAGHWGLDAISQAYANKRIMGYPDNTFRPNNDITRAEAVTILNSLFDRGINEAGLANVRKDIVEFKDLDRSHWAYYQIIEASNTHEFYRAKDGEVPEVWVRVLKTWNDFLK